MAEVLTEEEVLLSSLKVSELKLLSCSAQYSLDSSVVPCFRLFFNPAVFLCQVQLGVVWSDEVFVGPNHILHFHKLMVVLIFRDLSN